MIATQSDTEILAKRLRVSTLQMVHQAKASHIGSCLSCADLLAVLYGKVIQVDPKRLKDPHRDRFILSKGHATAILYATLAERGFFPKDWLCDYTQPGSLLLGHASHHVPGVEFSTGSLGHGLPVGAGIALSAQRQGLAYHTYVLLSDGELDEGSNWEAILFAAHHGLNNLTAIVDYNKIQSFGSVAGVMSLEPLADKWRAFGWRVEEIDGHHHEAILAALQSPQNSRPTVVIAHTIKGKGVSFMEGQLAWHYQSPSQDQMRLAVEELGGSA